MSDWKRKGLYYELTIKWDNGFVEGYTTKKLFFITYHLLRLIYGDVPTHGKYL